MSENEAPVQSVEEYDSIVEKVEETKSEVPKLAPHQPENQLEIDARSVFVGNVDFSAVPTDLIEIFKDCGVVNRVTILFDKFKRKPKGYAYIEFEALESVPKALEVTGTEFKGRVLNVSQKRTNIPHMGDNATRGGYGSRGSFRGRGRGDYRGRGRGGFRGRGGRGGRGSFRGRGHGDSRPNGRIPTSTSEEASEISPAETVEQSKAEETAA